MSKHFDYFVIGAGSGGVRSARIAASLGAKVGIAESTHFGGTCVNIGCVPKKLMAYAADFHAEFEDSSGFGWSYDTIRFDWKTFIANKNNEINRLNGIYENLLQKHDVEIFRGYASFADDKTVQVGDETITADHFLIAVGGVPVRLDFPGAEHTIVSDDAFYLNDLPEHIVIVGGGYIAVEFAHIFSGMGSEVSLVHRGERLLRGFDGDLAETLAEEMMKQGIRIYFNNEIQSTDKQKKSLSTKLSDGTVISHDQLLMAVGRAPNTGKLGLDKAGVEANKKGEIQVNDHYQTSNPHIYALGDVTGGLELTPVATAEGQTLAHHLFGEKGHQVHYQNVPTAIFSRPPIGTAGLSEDEARAQGYEIEYYKTRFRPMKNTLSGRDEFTVMKLVVDKKTNKVLGVHMIGEDAPEIMQGFAVALNAGATKADFDRTIGIHPTAAEEFVTMR